MKTITTYFHKQRTLFSVHESVLDYLNENHLTYEEFGSAIDKTFETDDLDELAFLSMLAISYDPHFDVSLLLKKHFALVVHHTPVGVCFEYKFYKKKPKTKDIIDLFDHSLDVRPWLREYYEAQNKVDELLK